MNDVKPSEIIILVSGAVLLIFSFLDWSSPGGLNGWDSFPLLAWPALLGTASAVLLAIQKFGNVSLPERVVGFTWPQLYLVAGLVALLITLGVLIGFDIGTGIGLIFSFFGAIGLLVGAFMLQSETATASPGSSPPQAF